MHNTIIIYTATNCSYSKKLKKDLITHGYFFEERNTSLRESYLQDLYDKAIFSLPVLFFNGQQFVGYHEDQVKEIERFHP